MQRIVCTGGSGFVGSHTIKALEELKRYEIINFDLKTGHDIRRKIDLDDVIQKDDIVLHLAAIARFAEADADPMLAFNTNAWGTENVAAVCAKKKAKKLIYSSTGSVYMPVEQEPPITEEFKARGNSVYACCKYYGELAVKDCGVPYTILRYAHLYGEGKIGHGAIGGFIDKMSRDLKPVVYGGQQSNDFTYIKDVVQANLLAIEKEAFNDVFNIGTGEELTTIRVFEILRDIFQYDKEFEVLKGRSIDPLRFVYDISKARNVLGFNPNYDFKKGMLDFKDAIDKGLQFTAERMMH